MSRTQRRQSWRIDWSTIDERSFNELVEMLFVAEYSEHPTLTARVIDGRGGDRGIDIAVLSRSTEDLIEVVQLKWFRQGMSGGFVSRRKQVKSSFDRAHTKSPTKKWAIVMPGEGTIPEHEFVNTLGGDDVRTRLIGRAELNRMLSRHVEIESWALRSSTKTALGMLQRDSLALSRPADAAEELKRLKQRMDSRSQYWGTNIRIDGDSTTELIYAKRPDAAAREPLTVNYQIRWDEANATLRDEFVDIMEFGGSKTVVIPGEYISRWEQSGPDWFAGSFEPSEVHITSNMVKVGVPVEIIAVGQIGRRAARGVAALAATGSKGASLEIDSSAACGSAGESPANRRPQRR